MEHHMGNPMQTVMAPTMSPTLEATLPHQRRRKGNGFIVQISRHAI
jgi:hypothetical protein